MKNLTVKDSELNKFVTFSTRWIQAVFFTTALLLPAGVAAQSDLDGDDAYPQQETEIYEQQDNYQEQSTDPSEIDYSNPYQQPVITQSEQDQMDQAQSSLGLPDSRRPQFNNFFDAKEGANSSQGNMQFDEGF